MPDRRPPHFNDENGQPVSLDAAPRQTSIASLFGVSTEAQDKLKGQLALAQELNARQAAKLRWFRRLFPKSDDGSLDRSEMLAVLAHGIAREAMPWGRGEPASKQLREFVSQAFREANQALTGTALRAAVAALLTELAPKRRGPLPDHESRWKSAYSALAGTPCDSKNRSLRGPLQKLYAATVTSNARR
jgi:hypothetical protein